MEKSLVLEGGGTRGIYTAGVLDYLFEKEFRFDSYYGTSMGACSIANYLSEQPERNSQIIYDYINDKRYFNVLNFFKKDKEVMGMDFLFDTVPNKLNFFDYKTFFENDKNFIAVATDLDTGKAVYLKKKNAETKKDVMKMLRASSSLPGLANEVYYKDKRLLDGGISDSIPIKYCLKDGNDKALVVLTRDKTYRKSPLKGKIFYKRRFKEYPEFFNSLINRYRRYNEKLDFIKELEKNKDIFVIRPSKPINISRFERDVDVFKDLYNLGRKDAKRKFKDLKDYLNEDIVTEKEVIN